MEGTVEITGLPLTGYSDLPGGMPRKGVATP